MKVGHAEYGEIFLALLLVVGFVAANMVYTSYQKGDFSTTDMQIDLAGDTPSSVIPDISTNIPSSDPATGNASIILDASGMTTNDLLYEGLGRALVRFSLTPNHELYSSESFMWSISGNMTPGSIPIKENDLRASLVRFNGRYIDSLRGFSFTVFTPPQTFLAPESIRGIAVFISNSTELDAFERNSTQFVISYDPHPRRSQTIEGCKVVDSFRAVSENSTAITLYDIDCKLIYTTYP